MSRSNPKTRPHLIVAQQPQKKLKKIVPKMSEILSYHKKVKLAMIDLL